MPGHNAKPDFLDLNNNGNKNEPMKKAAAEKFKDKKVARVKKAMRKEKAA